MAANSDPRRRRERVPKPLSVPLWAALIGFLVFVIGIINQNAYNICGIGLIFFFWGLISAGFIAMGRRRRSKAARPR